jgi:amino acid adenylation domain-containing protein
MTSHLVDYLESSLRLHPARTAVVDPSGTEMSYGELAAQADRVAAYLANRGVEPGDRVGVVLPKSAVGVATLFGIMKAGAAYVPVDYTAPTDRARAILSDCQVRAIFVDHRLTELATLLAAEKPAAIVTVGGTASLQRTASWADVQSSEAPSPVVARRTSDLAYILYTSGSTGVPKGVMLTHENASSFVEWCSSVFNPTEADRFSSHAPFHFDLSILDLYVAIKHGASVHLISEELGKNPRELARFIDNRRLTVWYSTPSILTLLLQFGDLSAVDASSIRLVLFAGEVFPVKHLRALRRVWPAPTYYNLYGPTETNVCTFAKIPELIADDRDVPYPIGFACSHCESLVLDENGAEVEPGGEGLLYISGPSVFSGYWNRPVENAAAFVERQGRRWYNTGDVVRWVDGEGFLYVGRRDRMVKRRGFRIELGEIERAFYKHPRVHEAAVIAVPDPESGVRIVAFAGASAGDAPSIVELKAFCGRNLPSYMSPDRIVVRDVLPKTSTDKTDYQRLRRELIDGERPEPVA